MSDAGASTGCGITVLRTVDSARATKRWSWNATLGEWLKISYAAGAWFVPTEHQVTDLAALVSVLDQARRDPCAFVVRGTLTPAAIEAMAAKPDGRIRRRKHQKNGVDPTLAEVPRQWVMIDVDGWPLRASDDLASDPESAIDTAIHELLPDAFQDAECWWQLSSSAGFVPGYLKCHLFYWLAEPADNLHIKAVLKQHAPGVDRAPFSAAQPHFIADPVIEGGYDPLPRRTGWRRGLEQAVVLPALVAQAARPRPAGSGAAGHAGGVMDALALLGDGEGGEGFHAPLRAATLRYARECSRYGDRNDAAIKAKLLQAMQEVPRKAERGDLGTYDDTYLQRLIDGAFALLAGDAEIQGMRPHHKAAVDTLEGARAALVEHVGGFLGRALHWGALDETERAKVLPEHAALVVGVGAGKTTATRNALLTFIETAKAAGQPHRILWLVPTHKLGNETLVAMQRLGINAAIMRGRDAELPGSADPENYVEAERMCLNLDAVNDALSIHANVEQSVCGSGKKDSPCCPWRKGENQCAFQRQKAPVARADVIIVPHQSMFYDLAKEVRAGLGVVIVDESWWQAGLIPHREVNLEGFAAEPMTYPVLTKEQASSSSTSKVWRWVRQDSATNDLHTWSALAQQAFEATPDGELVSKAAVEAAGLTASQCVQACALEWRRMYEGAVYPGQTANDRRAMLPLAAGNAGIPRRAAIWRALQALLEGDATHTGRLQAGSRTTASGSFRTIVLHSRQDIRKEVAGLPMLLLDATMPLHIVRYYLPRVTLLAEVNPVAPHMQVHQVIGGWGKTSLVSHPRLAPDEARRRAGLVSELADFAALNSGDNGLVVTYEAIEPEFASRPGIRTGHFNAIAGLDTFGDVRSLFVVGRPLPDARDLRDMALALTGRAVAAEAGQVESRGALMEDGTGAAINVRAYVDADLEALRVAITEAEIVQAVGRGRGVNRTADIPLTVWLFADVATALPITRMARWADIRPGVLSRMAGRGLVLFGATDAARIYPDLFPSPDAARMAIKKEAGEGHFPKFPLGEEYIGGISGNRLVPVSYRPAGRGQQTRRALVLESRLEGLAEWLTEHLGAAVRVEVVQPDPNPDPPPAPRPPPPPPPAADDAADDDEPPPGHPAWDCPPVEEPDGRWVLADGPDLEEFVAAADLASGGESENGFWVARSGFANGFGEPAIYALADDPVTNIRMIRTPEMEGASMPYLSCDVPALHPDVPAYPTPGGGMTISCPYCGKLHRHGGTGHRLAHCADPRGRGYVLIEAGTTPPWAVPHAPVAVPDRELRR